MSRDIAIQVTLALMINGYFSSSIVSIQQIIKNNDFKTTCPIVFIEKLFFLLIMFYN